MFAAPGRCRQIRRGRHLRSGCVAEPLEKRLLLAAVSWTGAGGDNLWHNALNWSGNILPGAADDVTISVQQNPTIALNFGGFAINSLVCDENLIISGVGSLSIAASSTLAGLTTLASGSLSGSGLISITGSMVWTGGTMSGTGTTLFPTGSALLLTGGTHQLNRTLHVDSILDWDRGNIELNGGRLINNGEFKASTRSTWGIHAQGYGNLVSNSGVLNKEEIGTVFISVALGDDLQFVNSGAVNVNAGTLYVGGQGTCTGRFNIAPAAKLELSESQTFSGPGAEIDGIGRLNISGKFIANSSMTLECTVVFQGTIDGAGILTFANRLEWNVGSMQGSGTTVLPAGSVLIVSSGGNLNRTLEMNSVTEFLDTTISAAGPFINNGTIDFSGGSGQISGLMNQGLLNVNSGTFAIRGPGTVSGTISVASAATLSLENEITVPADAIVEGAGNLTIANGRVLFESTRTWQFSTVTLLNFGVLAGAGDLTFTGAFNWLGGRMSGTGKTIIASTSSLLISGNDTYLERTLENYGNTTWTSGFFNANSGTFKNYNLFTATSNATQFWQVQIGNSSFLNFGTLRKQGSGTVQFIPLGANALSLSSAGSIEVLAGTLSLESSGTFSGQISVANSATLRFAAAVNNLIGPLSMTGDGNFLVNGGTLRFAGFIQAPPSITQTGGTITFDSDASLNDATISGGSWSGSGVVTLTGSMTWSGGVLGGTGMFVVAPDALCNITGLGRRDCLRRLSVEGQVQMQPNMFPGFLELILLVSGLEFGSGGWLNASNNALIVDYESPSSPLTQLYQSLVTGYHDGAWDGSGISSSVIASEQAPKKHALGIAETSTMPTIPASFGLVDNSAVVVRYTLIGDADLNQVVNLGDFDRMASNFGTSALWSEGNFNFDSTVNLVDFNMLVSNFGLPVGPQNVAGFRSPFAGARRITEDQDALADILS